MIETITKKQEQQIPIYYEKWLNMPLKPMDKKIAFSAIERIYSNMGKNKPIIIVAESPMQAVLFNCLCNKLLGNGKNDNLKLNLALEFRCKLWEQLRDKLREQLGGQLRDKLREQLRDKLREQLGGQLRDKLREQLGGQLEEQLWEQLRDKLREQLGGQLRDKLRGQLRWELFEQLREQLREQLDREQFGRELRDIVKNYYFITGWEPFCSLIDYCEFIGVKFNKDKFNLLMDLTKEVCFIIPYNGICFISEKPKEIHWQNKRLHNEKGKSVKYSDGWGIYSLNGVSVPDWLVNTPESKLSLDDFLKLKDADVKAEFIRKFGIDRMKSKGKIIDSWENYENHKNFDWFKKSEYKLIDMSPIFTKLNYAPYLCMKNQSVEGVFHMEAVPKTVKTVLDAVNFRIGSQNAKIINIK